MMYPWAVPGVKVVCVDDNIPNEPGYEPAHFSPVKGGIYTIREIEIEDDRVWLLFNELDYDDMFDAFHFRPMATRTQEQDVAIFTHLLTGTPVPA